MGSQAEQPSRQESIKMRIILLLTVFTTLGLCQSPPRTPLTQPPQGQRCAGRNFNGRRCCTPESPCGYGEGDCDGPLDGGANDVTVAVRETWCVAATTARSLAHTSMKRMTAVIFRRPWPSLSLCPRSLLE